MADFTLAYHGSISVLTPISAVAKDWVAEHIGTESVTWWCGGVVIEHRHVDDVVNGAMADGLEVEDV